MRTVGTGKVRLHQLKIYCIDLAVTIVYIAVNGIHDSQIWPSKKLKAVSDIHR